MNRNSLLILFGIFASVIIQQVACKHSFQGTDVHEYAQESFIEETGIGTSNQMKDDFFIMFYAGWCPHCQKFMPTWLKLKEEFPTDNIAAVHCPDNHDLCQTLKVAGYPTLILFLKNGRKMCRYDGSRDIKSVKKFWEERCKEEGTQEKVPFDAPETEEEEELLDQMEVKQTDFDGELSHNQEDIQGTKKPDSKLDPKKNLKKFKKQTEENIMQIKDYLRKLGPLTVVGMIALMILCVTYTCNKCFSYEQEDPFTKTIVRKIEKKQYQSASTQNRSQYDI